ncbi:uncharacterized protein JN550_008482 [Neoarthrinium moseri]|uniref:uncharacterized protein n=1 Tax=Neoarthrinium moseri TaxID=1658444 RepID=UPI001FDE50A2|nr:uncharacterized protein JN550_008482 [Neoarthrinium moseri]KAI1864936.1 hypothetical protein JN550_008482 [Neoarthrinium moseri]
MIHVARREKIALYCVFGIGAFATAISCVRLQSIYVFTFSKDPFHDSIPVNLWSVIEVNSAIICATIPSLKPLFRFRRLVEMAKKNSNYEYHGNERSGDLDASGEAKNAARRWSDKAVGRDPVQPVRASIDSEGSIELQTISEVYLRI